MSDMSAVGVTCAFSTHCVLFYNDGFFDICCCRYFLLQNNAGYKNIWIIVVLIIFRGNMSATLHYVALHCVLFRSWVKLCNYLQQVVCIGISYSYAQSWTVKTVWLLNVNERNGICLGFQSFNNFMFQIFVSTFCQVNTETINRLTIQVDMLDWIHYGISYCS